VAINVLSLFKDVVPTTEVYRMRNACDDTVVANFLTSRHKRTADNEQERQYADGDVIVPGCEAVDTHVRGMLPPAGIYLRVYAASQPTTTTTSSSPP
jgi:hypothetical protein